MDGFKGKSKTQADQLLFEQSMACQQCIAIKNDEGKFCEAIAEELGKGPMMYDDLVFWLFVDMHRAHLN
jgi:hypothetical protein